MQSALNVHFMVSNQPMFVMKDWHGSIMSRLMGKLMVLVDRRWRPKRW